MHPQSDHSACWQDLLDRLRSEPTRLAAVKAFARIAQSPLELDLSPVLEPLLVELTSYLRNSNRHLRQASLAALEVMACYCEALSTTSHNVAFLHSCPDLLTYAVQAVMSAHGAAVSSTTVAAAVDQVVLLVSSADMLMTPLALHFCLTLLPQQPNIAAQISAKFLPAALELVKSPLLQVRSMFIRCAQKALVALRLGNYYDFGCLAGGCTGGVAGFLSCHFKVQRSLF